MFNYKPIINSLVLKIRRFYFYHFKLKDMLRDEGRFKVVWYAEKNLNMSRVEILHIINILIQEFHIDQELYRMYQFRGEYLFKVALMKKYGFTKVRALRYIEILRRYDKSIKEKGVIVYGL